MCSRGRPCKVPFPLIIPPQTADRFISHNLADNPPPDDYSLSSTPDAQSASPEPTTPLELLLHPVTALPAVESSEVLSTLPSPALPLLLTTAPPTPTLSALDYKFADTQQALSAAKSSAASTEQQLTKKFLAAQDLFKQQEFLQR